jgi:hypothetical protein
VNLGYWHSPALKARGFLVLRQTLKLSILAAILEPNTRSKEPSTEPNLDNSRGVVSPSFRELLLLFLCAPQYVFDQKS